MVTVDERLSSIEAAIVQLIDLNTNLSQSLAEQRRRTLAMEKRADAMEQKAEAMEKRADAVEEWAASTERRADAVEEWAASTERRTVNLEDWAASSEKRAEDMEKRAQAAEQSLESVKRFDRQTRRLWVMIARKVDWLDEEDIDRWEAEED